MSLSMHKTPMYSIIAVVLLAGFSYLLFDGKSSEHPIQQTKVSSNNDKKPKTDNLISDSNKSKELKPQLNTQSKAGTEYESKVTHEKTNEESKTIAPDEQDIPAKLRLEKLKYIVNKFENEAIDYYWSENRKYSITNSFSKALHDSTHKLTYKVECKSTICRVAFRLEPGIGSTKNYSAFIQLLIDDLNASGWRYNSYNGLVSKDKGIISRSFHLYDFDESQLADNN